MIKFLIACGIGFSPGGPKYIVTRGFGIGAEIVITDYGIAGIARRRRRRKQQWPKRS